MKKLLYITIGIVAILIVTNPSITAFKSYRGKETYEGLRRPLNFWVCSVYRDKGSEFIGILGNFWRVTQHYSATGVSTIDLDSARMSDTSIHTSSDKLLMLYKELKSNENIKGIPSDYSRFKAVMENPVKAKRLYDTLKASDGVSGLPDTYSEFSEKLGLNK